MFKVLSDSTNSLAANHNNRPNTRMIRDREVPVSDDIVSGLHIEKLVDSGVLSCSCVDEQLEVG